MLEVWRKVADMSIDSVVITDKDAKIVYVNEAFTENTGYTSQEVLGKNPNILKGDNADEVVNYQEMWDTLKVEKEWSGEFFNKDKFGDHFWEFARIAPTYDSAGDLYYVAVKQNITKVKSLEGKLSCLYEKAERVSDATEQAKEDIKDMNTEKARTRSNGP